MRDIFTGGNVHVAGNVNITDNSHQEHKLLVQCSNEELMHERPFRQENIRLEGQRKVGRLLPFIGVAILLFVVASAWAQLNGKVDLVAFISGLGSMILGAASIKAAVTPNAFERQERHALREIDLILRSRRAA